MRSHAIVLALSALTVLSAYDCDPPRPAPTSCDPDGEIRSALDKIRVSTELSLPVIPVLVITGTLSPVAGATAVRIINSISAATEASLAEVNSKDSKAVCYSSIAKKYADVLTGIPDIPAEISTEINVLIGAVDVLLDMVDAT